MFPLLDGELREYADRRFAERADLIAKLPAASSLMDTLSGDRLTLMRLAYGTPPANDVIDCDPSVLLSFADHALMLRRTMSWTRDLPVDLFVHYVFWPRINNEALADCRPLCHRELIDRVRGLDATHAMLETNYWCAEHVTYHPSDNRTLNAIGALNLGLGRCGEESTLLVTALRAIGIPARQVYTPRWAHCDDNHAWVEAYVDGHWHFLGACEPEEVPDRGWFDKASTRAMLVHARVFCDFSEGNVDASASAGGDGTMLLCNLTADYAPTTDLAVTVTDGDGRLVVGANVAFELLNMAEYYPIATAVSDGQGRACMTLGKGSIRVHVSHDGTFADVIVNTADTDAVTVVLSSRQNVSSLSSRPSAASGEILPPATSSAPSWHPIDLIAPPSGTPRSLPLTDEQQRRTIERRAQAESMRAARVAGFANLIDATTRQALADRYRSVSSNAAGIIPSLLSSAGANAPVIAGFLLADTDADPAVADRDRLAMLSALSVKDLCDVSAAALDDAVRSAAAIRDYALDTALSDVPESDRYDRYARYVLDPRVGYEPLAGDRTRLQAMLERTVDTVTLRAQPQLVRQYLLDHIDAQRSAEETPEPISPTGMLTAGIGTPRSLDTAFVTVCRALGIPARFDPQTGEPEYFQGDAFHHLPVMHEADNADASTERMAALTVVAPAGGHPAYGTDWSLGRLVDGAHGTDFASLDLWERAWDNDRMTLSVEAGLYRLITTVRLPNGGQQTNETTFRLDAGEVRAVTLVMREPSEDELLEHIVVDDATFHATTCDDTSAADDGTETACDRRAGHNSSDETRHLSQLLPDRAIVAILDAHGSEPSIHVLDELIARLHRGTHDDGSADDATAGKVPDIPVVFAACPVDAPLSATLRSMFDRLDGGSPIVWRCDETTYERLTRGMYVDPDKLPMILVARKDGDRIIGVYASTGYNVGSVDLAFRLAAK
ncbi:transglutaminase [Bifidobacterium biavatii DSM 23969]|uniref:Transglutaminase n=2 Tax=Bifidobacterium biavatii TaxID=762212 RepID=A0A086ZSG3_9BIFI|nr:transglutaminase [Bifidobacterium biavatii DSM 23969]